MCAMIAKLRMRAASMNRSILAGCGAGALVHGPSLSYAVPNDYYRRPTTHPESGIIDRYSCRRGDGSSCIPDVDSGLLRPAPEAGRTQALSARAHARATVPLQPGLRRMWQDPVSGPHLEERSLAGRLLQSGRRLRSADGVDSGRRAADASADRRNCRRPGRAQEIYLSLHQRAAAERKVASVQAQQVPELLSSRGRTERAPRFFRVPRRWIRTCAGWHPRGRCGRLPRDHQYDPVRWRGSQQRAQILRRDDGSRGREHDGLARIFLRQGARPETLYGTRTHAAPVPHHAFESQEDLAVQSVAAFSRIPDGQAQLQMHALGHADL